MRNHLFSDGSSRHDNGGETAVVLHHDVVSHTSRLTALPSRSYSTKDADRQFAVLYRSSASRATDAGTLGFTNVSDPLNTYAR